MKTDIRLIGRTAENIFLAQLNQRGIFATSFDTEGFDGIIFDHKKVIFSGGKSPYYTQIKCRGSKNNKFNSQGHNVSVIENIKKIAYELNICDNSLYFTVGFFKFNDIRTIQYYSINFTNLNQFKGKNNQYRFSVKACEQAIIQNPGMIVKL